jgi:tRNA threonylcarbamoyladenosine biosynthesis protein TsaB
MSLILNIDTATEIAQVSITRDGIVLKDAVNKDPKEHAAFVQPAIKSIMAITGIALAEIDAVAVMVGPGSYTGLRVGMASAKGLCYALNKPLLAINTLESMAMAAIITGDLDDKKLLCPMIDARRSEVFTAIYDHSLNVLLAPEALILDENSYSAFLERHPVVFFGNGSEKWKAICKHANAEFQCINIDSAAMALLSFKKYSDKTSLFTDPAYLDPLYIKEFYSK